MSLGLGNDTLHMTPKSQGKKKKKQVNWTSSKLQTFVLQTIPSKKFKKIKLKQLTEWEKIFANDVTNKVLISKIYKQLIQHNIEKTTYGMGENICKQ